MSIPVQFDEKDLARGTIVEPAWYRVKVDSITTKPSKDGGSTNYVAEATIICNADTGNTEFAGIPLVWNFNSKAMGFAQGFIKALIGPDAKLTAGERYDLESAVGKELDVMVVTGEWNGNFRNEVKHNYRYPKQG